MSAAMAEALGIISRVSLDRDMLVKPTVGRFAIVDRSGDPWWVHHRAVGPTSITLSVVVPDSRRRARLVWKDDTGYFYHNGKPVDELNNHNTHLRHL